MNYEVEKQIISLETSLAQAFSALSINERTSELAAMESQAASEGFWNNQEHAQQVSKDIARLRTIVEPWLQLQQELNDIKEFLALKDDSLLADITEKLTACQRSYESHKRALRFTHESDTSNAVVTIQAGAGGTDAQDWAEMLKKMYLRWAEKQQMKVTVLDESSGEQAGIKQCSFIVEGAYAYGQLRGEHGVHRLVRQSPFNSAGSRETSFAMVEVIPEIATTELGEIQDKDLKIDVFRAGGHGGQSVNTTDSAVRITHIPTGIVVSIQNERSQQQNKDVALKILHSKLAVLAQEQHKEKIDDLKGPNIEAAWGNQIRSYVLHPYTMVKDARSKFETSDVQSVLGGDIQPMLDAYLDSQLGITSTQKT